MLLRYNWTYKYSDGLLPTLATVGGDLSPDSSCEGEKSNKGPDSCVHLCELTVCCCLVSGRVFTTGLVSALHYSQAV